MKDEFLGWLAAAAVVLAFSLGMGACKEWVIQHRSDNIHEIVDCITSGGDASVSHGLLFTSLRRCER